MSNIVKAILKINPNAEVSVKNDDINEIIWENGTTPISKADIEAKMVEVQAEYDAKKARIASAKTKLQNLGLTLDEVKDAFNI